MLHKIVSPTTAHLTDEKRKAIIKIKARKIQRAWRNTMRQLCTKNIIDKYLEHCPTDAQSNR